VCQQSALVGHDGGGRLRTAEDDVRRHQRGVVPRLPVRDPLVVDGDQLRARLDDALADRLAERVPAALLEQVERDAELEQPDRLDVRAEKDARRSEDVIAIRVLQVTLGVPAEDAARQRGVARIATESVKQCRVHGTLGEPQLIPVEPEAVVQLAAVQPAADSATVLVWIERVELEE
jgi:hypothetical protein